MLKRKSCNAPFKPPLKVSKSEESTAEKVVKTKHIQVDLAKEVESLRDKHSSICNEIKAIEAEGYSTDNLSDFIEKLHEYNELKDIGQALFGQLAVLQGETIKSLYERYGVNVED